MTQKRAVVLLSGGVDSSTALAVAKNEGFEVHALTFRYGQRHAAEIAAAERVAARIGVAEHVIATIDLRMFGGSALTSEVDVPKDRNPDDIARGIPITYVPARNTIFLSFALAWAEVLHAHDIFIGVNAVDYSGYPDCRPEYIAAFEKLSTLATKAGTEGTAFRIHTPLIQLSKAETVALGMRLEVDFSDTSSCYDPDDGRACGRCDSCHLRLRAFEEVGLSDPIPYSLAVA